MAILDHRPYYANGKEIPSVTTVLQVLNKPELVHWANWMGRKGINTDELLKESATIGTFVHHYIEKICKKKLVCYKEMGYLSDSKQRSIKTGVKSFKQWKKDKKPKFIHNELRVMNNMFGGTIDCICSIGKDNYMIDFKTSKKAHPTYFLQLAAYNYLYKTTTKNTLDYVAILVVDKKKIKYDFVCMSVEYLEKFYEPIFFILLELYNKWNDNLITDWDTKFIKDKG